MQLLTTERTYICYARADKIFVLELAEKLKTAGFSVWIDVWDIRLGMQWMDAIIQGIKDCANFLIVLSPASVESDIVQRELQMALDEKKFIVPVLYKECETPSSLHSLQYIDCRSQNFNDAATFQRLLHILSGISPSGR